MAKSSWTSERNLLIAMLVFSLICFSVSILIQIKETTKAPILDTICPVTPTGSGCQDVQSSKYSSIFGIKLSLLGILGFLALSILITIELFRKHAVQKKLIIYKSMLVGIGGIALILIQAFILNTFCTYCLIIDFSSIILLVLAVLILRKR